MTATDELRRLLDERGVEYKTKDRPAADHADWEAWMHGDGHQPSVAFRRETLWGQPVDQKGETLKGVYHAKATEMGDRLFLEAQLVTPEQAIAATLGRGECQFKTVKQFIDARRDRADICECDHCGYRCARGFIQDERFKYCPNCGRKVVGDVLRTEWPKACLPWQARLLLHDYCRQRLRPVAHRVPELHGIRPHKALQHTGWQGDARGHHAHEVLPVLRC